METKNKSKPATAAKNRYNAKAYDSLRIVVPKGQKADIQAHAEKHDGGSINGFVRRAIDQTMEQDKSKE